MRRKPAKPFAALVVIGVLAAGCSSQLSPKEQLKEDTATLVEAANAQDLTALQTAASRVSGDIQTALSRGVISEGRARNLRQLLAKIVMDAPLLTEPSPTPAPTTSSPTPSPTPSPTHSPTPSPTASPTPSPTASPTPSPTSSPTFSVGLGGSASPTNSP